jgi:hypothetical protein
MDSLEGQRENEVSWLLKQPSFKALRSCGRWHPKDKQRQSREKTGTAHALDPTMPFERSASGQMSPQLSIIENAKRKQEPSRLSFDQSQVLLGARSEHQARRPN